ncbi:DUF1284 domain-containing protein [Piscibacillus salipiscarius]|uniref:DUF1284 domain-containing protein n=1 Tax=Piscibacillus salipiscarius TaxID=299480 RepID=A0ABW5Q8P8_9BACI|nr:DUF1284 domain-containing protein [Piscibacillus salipiscarius]
MYLLRGHHLFCLLGYRGMGYSKEYVENMTQLHQQLRQEPKTLVKFVKGPDCLCEKYPNSGDYHCEDQHIYDRDATILEKLGFEVGQVVPWTEVENQIKENVVPSDLSSICDTCSWRTYGVCEEGVQDIIDGNGLRKVE